MLRQRLLRSQFINGFIIIIIMELFSNFRNSLNALEVAQTKWKLVGYFYCKLVVVIIIYCPSSPPKSICKHLVWRLTRGILFSSATTTTR